MGSPNTPFYTIPHFCWPGASPQLVLANPTQDCITEGETVKGLGWGIHELWDKGLRFKDWGVRNSSIKIYIPKGLYYHKRKVLPKETAGIKGLQKTDMREQSLGFKASRP